MMDTDRMAGRYRQLQRATVARSALDVIALIFLGCGFAFWGVAFWQLLAPPALLSLLGVQVAVLALVYALATPLLWSALVPSTPAGQLLQKTQWRTFGFAAIVCAALFLSYQAETMIELWLWAQPGVQEAGFARSLAISLSIAFILIPALAWTQLTPERWLAQIQQAHQVKKLEMQQRGELAIIKASLVRAETLAAIGWANLLPVEKEEAVAAQKGLLMAASDTMRSIVRTLGISADLERSIMGDDEIADQLDYVTREINIVPTIGPPDSARESTATIVYAPPTPTRDTAPAHGDSRLEPSIPRAAPDAARPQATPHDAAYLRAARDAFGRRPWTLKQLASELKIGDTSAGALRDSWLADGSARQVNLGRWSFDTAEGGT